MSFWNTSDGQSAQNTEGKFEMGGGDIAPIPDETSVLAIAEEAKNSEYQGDEYVNIKWRISKPAEYANRVIYQKARPYDADPAKADKGKRMLAAIASNAGGGLFKAMEQRGEARPSDMSLAQICNRPMVLKLGVWSITEDRNGNPLPAGEHKSGNWVKAVSPAKAGTQAAPAPAPAPKPAPDDSWDDDIPF